MEDEAARTRELSFRGDGGESRNSRGGIDGPSLNGSSSMFIHELQQTIRNKVEGMGANVLKGKGVIKRRELSPFEDIEKRSKYLTIRQEMENEESQHSLERKQPRVHLQPISHKHNLSLPPMKDELASLSALQDSQLENLLNNPVQSTRPARLE